MGTYEMFSGQMGDVYYYAFYNSRPEYILAESKKLDDLKAKLVDLVEESRNDDTDYRIYYPLEIHKARKVFLSDILYDAVKEAFTKIIEDDYGYQYMGDDLLHKDATYSKLIEEYSSNYKDFGHFEDTVFIEKFHPDENPKDYGYDNWKKKTKT